MALVDYNDTDDRLRQVTDLLGGARIFRKPVKSSFEAHEALLKGLPTGAVLSLFGELIDMEQGPALEKAIGMSARTLQRKKSGTDTRLNADQSSRAWKFAEVLARATEVFGSQKKAESWIETPVMGLNGARPIDLMATAAGTEMVQTHLLRLEYGVYA